MPVDNIASAGQSPDVKADDASKAEGLLREMQTISFVKFMNFMIDNIAPL